MLSGCTGAQLLQHQQLTQALSALLANGAAAGAGQNGFTHAGVVEVRISYPDHEYILRSLGWARSG